MLKFKNQSIPLSTVAIMRANHFAKLDDYEVGDKNYKANVDYIESNPKEAINWMFENTKPTDFDLDFNEWGKKENLTVEELKCT